MASDSERPELEAYNELQQLIRHLADELASFRKRALTAESRLKALDAGEPDPKATGRSSELERENRELRARLDGAAERTRQMLDRVRFLRQQAKGAER